MISKVKKAEKKHGKAWSAQYEARHTHAKYTSHTHIPQINDGLELA